MMVVVGEGSKGMRDGWGARGTLMFVVGEYNYYNNCTGQEHFYLVLEKNRLNRVLGAAAKQRK